MGCSPAGGRQKPGAHTPLKKARDHLACLAARWSFRQLEIGHRPQSSLSRISMPTAPITLSYSPACHGIIMWVSSVALLQDSTPQSQRVGTASLISLRGPGGCWAFSAKTICLSLDEQSGFCTTMGRINEFRQAIVYQSSARPWLDRCVPRLWSNSFYRWSSRAMRTMSTLFCGIRQLIHHCLQGIVCKAHEV